MGMLKTHHEIQLDHSRMMYKMVHIGPEKVR